MPSGISFGTIVNLDILEAQNPATSPGSALLGKSDSQVYEHLGTWRDTLAAMGCGEATAPFVYWQAPDDIRGGYTCRLSRHAAPHTGNSNYTHSRSAAVTCQHDSIAVQPTLLHNKQLSWSWWIEIKRPLKMVRFGEDAVRLRGHKQKASSCRGGILGHRDRTTGPPGNCSRRVNTRTGEDGGNGAVHIVVRPTPIVLIHGQVAHFPGIFFLHPIHPSSLALHHLWPALKPGFGSRIESHGLPVQLSSTAVCTNLAPVGVRVDSGGRGLLPSLHPCRQTLVPMATWGACCPPPRRPLRITCSQGASRHFSQT
ncbi:hypothetical protein COCCADRAFT_25728 [Bipolaris zeicola 26-R-13]|uniref:Uncharacterized protein n=1 Tax=Cochliobolus carbonum (strain 26-R-13) TaxID=930089 RepID=W6YEW3_COCC2|nr:uncharacterized protein COCCADRAFT_25728 [Bipolaris zeicola 26-R-13]EUC34044.1 hypothetical protein COCCADRAFT_25728 [Bipolaris zeicola 26-R-13]